ncbi:MAG: thiamine phosphate synthase [Candidatus Omnitrophota bacterium]
MIISEKYGHGRGAVDIAKSAIAGGADIIQMREKNKPRDEFVSLGNMLAGLCKEAGVTFIVNDDPILAKQVDADGVHLGQEDLALFKVEEARAILGKDKIIGISTSSIKDVEEANSKKDIDYIGFGPVFPTVVKEKCVGTKEIEKVLKISEKPVFFIGGISLNNIGGLLTKGACNVAVIRAILESDDIEEETKIWKSCLSSARSTRNSSTK